jgi:hypothetical protein
MPTKRKSTKPESQRQAEWVRAHPTAEGSSFPEYPDEIKRRGSSRGALPIGNPWGSEAKPKKPDARFPRAVDSTLPASRKVEAPPKSPTPRAVIRGVVTGVDVRIAEQVSERLAQSKALDDHHIELRVHDGEVELQGEVASQEDSFEAERLASSVRGVVRVINQLRAQPQ